MTTKLAPVAVGPLPNIIIRNRLACTDIMINKRKRHSQSKCHISEDQANIKTLVFYRNRQTIFGLTYSDLQSLN